MSVSVGVLMIFSFFQTRTLPLSDNYQHSWSLAEERIWEPILYINLYSSPSFIMVLSSTFPVITKFGVSQLYFVWIIPISFQLGELGVSAAPFIL